jgi:hypothetical protein
MLENLQDLIDEGDLYKISEFGLIKKREGDFVTAKAAYEVAITLARGDMSCHYNLAKVCYLAKEKIESIVNYMTVAHISLQNANKMYASSSVDRGAFLTLTRGIPKDEREFVAQFSPDALLIFVDTNTPRHLGHALFDLETDFPTPFGLKEHVKNYRDSLKGSPTNPPNDHIEMEFYLKLGRYFILENLRWDSFDTSNPADFYMNMNLFHDEISTQFFQKCFNTDFVFDWE